MQTGKEILAAAAKNSYTFLLWFSRLLAWHELDQNLGLGGTGRYDSMTDLRYIVHSL